MAKCLQEWLDSDVRSVSDKGVKWLSQHHFFRDPSRPIHSDSNYFFAPADGIIIYQDTVEPDECIVDIKGRAYSLRQALRDEAYDQRSLVIGIFMTFYDVHINRLPFAGRVSYKALEPIDTHNYPMLDLEKSILEELRVDVASADYLHNNQRMVNRVYASALKQWYYVLQIADYDVDCIMPFELKQNWPCAQNERFSQIRYGSQVDLIVPLSRTYDFATMLDPGMHVEAGIDPIIRITERSSPGN